MNEEVDDLVERWESHWLAGNDLAVDVLCQDHPSLIADVSQKIHSLKAINRLLDIKPSTLGSPVETLRDRPTTGSSSHKTFVSTTSNYQILRPHAQGGLGEILIGQDTAIGRNVAIKVIQSRFDHDPARQQRFLREAEITGKLEHPGIVPVHGIGQDEYGSPCYAMRFVEGKTLQESIDDHHQAGKSFSNRDKNLSLRKLLQRFISVCNAIAFAHSRGVIHRDIKPSNIVVGNYGETIVIDWGLAKQIGGNDPSISDQEHDAHQADAGETSFEETGIEPALTAEGKVLGTLCYMSPEQARGASDLTIQTDVYSLGATLYTILTGKRPFGDEGNIPLIGRVRTGQLTPPRALSLEIPRALEAICLKAMATDPKKRYATAIDLASDLEGSLADEKITALDDSWLDHTLRWTRRHRLLVVATGVAIAVAFVGLGMQLWTISRTNAMLTTAFTNESQAKNAAIQQQRVAQQNAMLADEQSALARGILQEVIENVQRDLRSVPASQKARREILLKSMTGLAKVSQSLESRPLVDRMKMLAHRDLGDVYRLIGNEEGVAGTRSAHTQFLAALNIAEKLFQDSAGDRQSRIDLAYVYRRMSLTTLELNSAKEAQQYLEKYLTLREQLAEEMPEDFEAQFQYVSALNTSGDYYIKERSFDQAATHFERALELIQKLHTDSPELVEANPEFVSTFNNMGGLRSRQGQHSAAIEFYEKSLLVNRSRHSSHPNDAAIQQDLAFVLSALGKAYWAQGDFGKVEPYYREALDLRQRCYLLDGNNMFAGRQLMQSHEGMGDLMLKLKRQDDAKEHYLNMLGICQKHATLNPESHATLRDLSVAQKRIADICWEADDKEGALTYLQDALNSDRERQRLDATDKRARVDVASSSSHLATKYLELERIQEATELLVESAAILRQNYATNPEDSRARRNLSVVLSQLGAAYRRAADFDKARNCNDESIQLIQNILDKEAKNASVRIDLISVIHARGVLERSAENIDGAKLWFQKALGVVEQLESEKLLVGSDLEWRDYIEKDLQELESVNDPR